jgi:hypothetical protein
MLHINSAASIAMLVNAGVTAWEFTDSRMNLPGDWRIEVQTKMGTSCTLELVLYARTCNGLVHKGVFPNNAQGFIELMATIFN